MPTPTYLYDYKIGSTLVGLTNLEGLTVPLPPPHAIYKSYQNIVPLGDMTTRGIGFPSAVWRWASLTDAQRDQLRSFCAGSSAEIYIRTRTNENTNEYKSFKGVMIWPTEEDPDSYSKVDFIITFVGLVVQT
jgi:hypothetical protein